MAFKPTGDHSKTSLPRLHLLHGSLPREVVCTENLTPFLKLLPCKGKAGVSSLLDGHKLFDASWQSMAIDVRPVCANDGSKCIVEMEQTVDMVLDIQRSKRPRGKLLSMMYCVHEADADKYQIILSRDQYRKKNWFAINRKVMLLNIPAILWMQATGNRGVWPKSLAVLSGALASPPILKARTQSPYVSMSPMIDKSTPLPELRRRKIPRKIPGASSFLQRTPLK